MYRNGLEIFKVTYYTLDIFVKIEYEELIESEELNF